MGTWLGGTMGTLCWPWGQPAAPFSQLGELLLPVLCPFSGFVEGVWMPLGVSPPCPTGYSGLCPSLCPQPHSLQSPCPGWPHPGTSSPRHSLVGHILLRAERSTVKEPHISSGLAQGQCVGSGPLLSTPRASPVWAHTRGSSKDGPAGAPMCWQRLCHAVGSQ